MLNRYVVMSNRIARLIQLKSWRGFTPQHADQVSNLVFHGAHFTDSRTAVVVRPVVLCVRVPNSSSGCSCNVAWRWSEVATILMYLSIAGTSVDSISFSYVLRPSGFSALRMYAIYGRDRRILSLVTVMGVINPIVNIVGYLPLPRSPFTNEFQYYNTTLSFQAMPPPFTGCGQSGALGEGPNLIL